MNELWKDIEGTNGKYKVSNTGLVKSLTRKEEIILKCRLTNYGYREVGISLKGKRKSKTVHRIVAETFLEKPNGHKLQVNHIDGNKENNNVLNLEWCTPRENIVHGYENGLIVRDRGSKHWKSKLDEFKVLTIRTMLESGISVKEISEKYNVTSTAISDVKSGKTWGWLKTNRIPKTLEK